MPSADARAMIRSAQDAEAGGDLRRAEELLRAAAARYEATGQAGRAEQLRRHVDRLRTASAQVASNPTGSPESAVPTGGRTASTGAASTPPGLPESAVPTPEGSGPEPDDAPTGGRARRARSVLVERAPTLADPGAPAWCSFCCRPHPEVGPLVAGPAGAFVCGACVELAAALLAGRR